jgi:hypothetical protein
VLFQYVIGDSNLEGVDVINDFDVLVDSRMTFVNHIESIVSKSGNHNKTETEILSFRTL